MSTQQDLLLNNNFLLVLAAIMQQQQLQQLQQEQQQLQQQQQQQQNRQPQQQHQQQQQPLPQLQQQQQQSRLPQHQQSNTNQHLLQHQECDPNLHLLEQTQKHLQLQLQQQHLQQQRQQEPNQLIQQYQRDLTLRLLESLFAMNKEPNEDAIDLIAQKINSTSYDVASWFQLRRVADRHAMEANQAPFSMSFSNQHQPTLNDPHLAHQLRTSTASSTLINAKNSNASVINTNTSANINGSPNSNNGGTTISCPSSSLLAKLSAATSRINTNIVTNKLDSKMIDFLEALYAINDSPEQAAIEMIARRTNVTPETLSDWFDKKRLKLNPFAGPRSPPAKKREGGRVVTFSEYQRSLLEAIFDENNYLHPQEYEDLSNLIQVPSRNIKIWFKNRRSKQRLSGRIASPCKSNNPD